MSEPQVPPDAGDAMRDFIDAVRDICPITVESTPEGGITSVQIGATDRLVEVAKAADQEKLLLVYDGASIRVIPENPESLPDETTEAR